jgi:hypothetical protein
LYPVVEALQALRGVQFTVTVTLVAAMGDLTRVENPRERMQCLGVIPSDSSSGDQRRQGAIPKAGHTQTRRVVVAGAWVSRYPATVSRPLPLRLEQPPQVFLDSRGKAQVRRCKRSQRLVARGNHATVMPVAMARARTGCIGAMAQAGPIAV